MSQSTPISQLPISAAREEEDPQKMNYLQQIMDEIRDADQTQYEGGGGGGQIEMPQQQQYASDDNNNNNKDDTFKVIGADDSSQNITDYLWNELREPLMFMLFFVIFNMPQIVYVLSKYIPWMINYQTGAATYTGLIIRGFFAGILYWLVQHYIMS